VVGASAVAGGSVAGAEGFLSAGAAAAMVS